MGEEITEQVCNQLTSNEQVDVLTSTDQLSKKTISSTEQSLDVQISSIEQQVKETILSTEQPVKVQMPSSEQQVDEHLSSEQQVDKNIYTGQSIESQTFLNNQKMDGLI